MSVCPRKKKERRRKEEGRKEGRKEEQDEGKREHETATCSLVRNFQYVGLSYGGDDVVLMTFTAAFGKSHFTDNIGRGTP